MTPWQARQIATALERGYLTLRGKDADHRQFNAWWDVCKRRALPSVVLHPAGRCTRLSIDLLSVPQARCPGHLGPLFDLLAMELRKVSSNRRTSLSWSENCGSVEHLDAEHGDLAARLSVRWLTQHVGSPNNGHIEAAR